MHTHYQNNYLNGVIFQVNYTVDSLKTTIHSGLVDLCKEVTGSEPVQQPMLNLQFAINSKSQPIQEQINSWIFDGDKFLIQIQHNSISIRDKKYIRHNEFHEVITSIVNFFNKIYQPTCSRVAMRYTNIIAFPEGNTYDFKDLIHDDLLNATLFFSKEGLARSIGAMNMIDDDGIRVNFVYGFLNQKGFPNKISKREFVLDYDCSIDDIVQSPQIEPYLVKLRTKVNLLFNKSILEKLREQMKPIS